MREVQQLYFFAIAVNESDVDLVGQLDNPVKIQVPRSATSLLKPGDGLQVDIRKVAAADYWIAVLFGQVL
jgi:hypothetical protein